MDINELRELLQLLRSQGVSEYSSPNLSLKLSAVVEPDPVTEAKPDPSGGPPEDVVRALSKLPAQYGRVMRGV